MQHTSLTPDEELNSLIYRTLLYVNKCRVTNFEKQSIFGPPCTCVMELWSNEANAIESSNIYFIYNHTVHGGMVIISDLRSRGCGSDSQLFQLSSFSFPF